MTTPAKPLEPLVLERERRFAIAYFEVCLEMGRDWGAALPAYRRAFPESPTSDSRAAQLASRLAAKPAVRRLVQTLRESESHRAAAPPEHGIANLERVAHANMLDYLRVDPDTGLAVVDLRGVTFEQMSAVQEIVTTEIETAETESKPATVKRKVTLKLYNKLQAQDQLNRIHGLYLDPATIQVSAAELGRLIQSMRRRMGIEIDGESSNADEQQ